MQAADLTPVPVEGRTQSGWDLFLLFAAANIVATTLQVGASLGTTLPASRMWLAVGLGSVIGAAMVAALAPVGSRLGVPSMIAARAVLGHTGARLVARKGFQLFRPVALPEDKALTPQAITP